MLFVGSYATGTDRFFFCWFGGGLLVSDKTKKSKADGIGLLFFKECFFWFFCCLDSLCELVVNASE